MTGTADLPGAIGVSRLRVYDWPADDGCLGGSPHLHTASAEGYVVVAGRGAVETVSAQGHARTPLAPGTLLWFTPGTVHRLINVEGLEIVTLMQNAGLPEAGDAVLTFPPEILADPAAYRARAALPATDDQDALGRAARARRDLALEGYRILLDRLAADPEGALGALHRAAAALVADRIPHWRELVEEGPARQVAETRRRLDELERGGTGLLAGAAVHDGGAPEHPERWGMCGRLTVWPSAAVDT